MRVARNGIARGKTAIPQRVDPSTPDEFSTARPRRRGSLSIAWGSVVAAALLVVGFPPGYALADPPPALPASADEADAKWQPAFDYDGDGCYPTPAVGPDGTIAEGLELSGAVNGNCHDASDLDNTNSYARAKCNDNGWCAYVYALYFEKDQAVDGSGLGGHTHDLEHVIVWVENDEARYVSPSAHGEYPAYAADEVVWEDTHPKIVYHKDGLGTHAFRLAGADEEPENHHGTWQYPALVSWNNFPDGVRDALTSADFGAATLDLTNGRFEEVLAEATPEGVPFDPYQ